jgi:hypothetical protein
MLLSDDHNVLSLLVVKKASNAHCMGLTLNIWTQLFTQRKLYTNAIIYYNSDHFQCKNFNPKLHYSIKHSSYFFQQLHFLF